MGLLNQARCFKKWAYFNLFKGEFKYIIENKGQDDDREKKG